MKRSVYLETSMIGHLVGRISKDLIIASHQRLAREWWNFRRLDYELYVSDFVLDEISAGDPTAATERLELVKDITILNTTEAVEKLGEKLVKELSLPVKAAVDAFHIGVAAVNGIDYVLTWNCAHIANVDLLDKIKAVCDLAGFKCPILCTPHQLLGAHT